MELGVFVEEPGSESLASGPSLGTSIWQAAPFLSSQALSVLRLGTTHESVRYPLLIERHLFFLNPLSLFDSDGHAYGNLDHILPPPH